MLKCCQRKLQKRFCSKEQACFDSFADKGITKLEVSDIEKWQEACAPLYEKESAEAQDIIAKIQGGNY